MSRREKRPLSRRACVVPWCAQHGGMDSAANPTKVRGRPFTGKDDPRFKPGPGRPALTPEQRLAQRVQARVINDVAAEMRQHAEAAIEALRKVIDRGEGAEVTGAAKVVLQYAFGNPKDSVDLTLNNGVRRITPEEIRTAALRLAASRADDVDIFG